MPSSLILSALLLLALQKTLTTARKANCANNLRQLAAATISYEGDNHNLISSGYGMSFWGMEYRFAGSYGVRSFYFNYLSPPINTANIEKGRKYDFYSLSYGLYTYSPQDRVVTIARASRVFSQNRGLARGTVPALWANRCQLAEGGTRGGFDETNHKLMYTDINTGISEGGNVSHVDGHVSWYFYVGRFVERSCYNPTGMSSNLLTPGSVCSPICENQTGVLQLNAYNSGRPKWQFAKGWPDF